MKIDTLQRKHIISSIFKIKIHLLNVIVPTKLFCLLQTSLFLKAGTYMGYVPVESQQSKIILCTMSAICFMIIYIFIKVIKFLILYLFLSRYTNYANYQWQVTPAHVVLFTDGASRKSFVSVVTQHGVRARLGFSVMVFFMDVYSIIKWISDEKDTNM